MKAITCTQCGASIENVSEHSIIVDCEYCGARMIMDAKSGVKPPPSIVDAPSFETQEPARGASTAIWTIVGAIALIPVLITLVVSLNKSKPKETQPDKTYLAPVVQPVLPVWTTPAAPEKPIPVVNYQPRVSWDGPNDMEYFDDPEVDISSVSDLTSEEVKKTVFKNRVVKLKVVINTEGEIDTVQTISGHPILVEAATASAKRSIFRSRSKPTTRILTYTFRVLKD